MSHRPDAIRLAPSFAAAVRLSAGFAATRFLRRRRRLVFGVLLLALPLLAAVAGAAAGRGGPSLAKGIVELHLGLLVPLLAALLGSGVFADEVEGRTIAYLFTRPVARPALLLGKLLAVAFPVGVAVALSGGLAALIASAPVFTVQQALLFSAPILLGLLLLALAQTALAAAVGCLWPRHAFAATVGLFAFFEGGIGHLPGAAKIASLTYHARIVGGLRQSSVLGIWDPSLPSWVSVLVLVVVAVAALAFAALAVTRREYTAAL